MHIARPLPADQAGRTTLRPMRETDLAACYALSQHLKWPHRLADWQFHHRVSRSWVVEQAQPTGPTVAGSGMLFHLGAEHASLGLVIIADSLQGQGLGRAMMEQLLADAGARSVVLNATEAGRPLYEKLGFQVIDTLSQHQGIAAPTPHPPLPPGARIRALRTDEAPALLALDRHASGMDRSALLSALLKFAKVAVLEQHGQIKGASLLRAFGRGWVIGPVIASTADDAKALIAYWVNAHPGDFLRIDVPGRCGLTTWLPEIGLHWVDGALTMCKGSAPTHHAQWRTYSIISQALG